MKFTVGFSPCPNDTFIFDALVNKKIDTGDLEFDAVLEDVQTLNQWAMQGKLDITKLSYGVLPLVLNDYAVLKSGSALGRGVGPLLITSPLQTSLESGGSTRSFEDKEFVNNSIIAIPGEQTTAHLLFSLAYPKAKKKTFLRYDAIENFVASGKGLGVIIHENRFTYQEKGLIKIIDLGDFWEKETGSAIPLGGIAVSRKIKNDIQQQMDALIKKSIEYAFSLYPELNDYIKNNAQEMSEEVMRQHINLYVNDYSINLGKEGKNAIIKLLQVYQQTNNSSIDYENIFIN
jgi:1,4-dihydroxy-6-naphthoate synthase